MSRPLYHVHYDIDEGQHCTFGASWHIPAKVEFLEGLMSLQSVYFVFVFDGIDHQIRKGGDVRKFRNIDFCISRRDFRRRNSRHSCVHILKTSPLDIAATTGVKLEPRDSEPNSVIAGCQDFTHKGKENRLLFLPAFKFF